MKRGKPLKRKSPMRRGPVRSKYKRRPRDMTYMAWVRKQPCLLSGSGECHGRVEADHAGQRPVGRKADDRTCIPLCRMHHTQRGSFSGRFRRWTKAEMRAWLDASVAYCRRMFTRDSILTLSEEVT